VTAEVTLPSRQLLAFGFDEDAAFEGQLVGALERLESGGALRILDVLFVAADNATGELRAINLQGGTGGLVSKLLDFRLDSGAQRRASERALADDTRGGMAQLLRDLGENLEPGSATALVLVEHVWSRALTDAVARVGGRALTSEFVDAATLSELAPDLPSKLQ
jgi:hypothetical protein